MRWSWLRAAILGILIGPASVSGEVAEVEDPAAAGPVGHAFRGLEFHVWDEDAREASDWAVELLRAGGHPAEMAPWRTVAEQTAVRPPVLTDGLEAQLASWGADPRVEDGPSPLGCTLCLLPSLDRTCLVASWATSPSEVTRRALARALSAPFQAVGVREALHQLQQDESAEVRRLARAATASRRAGLL